MKRHLYGDEYASLEKETVRMTIQLYNWFNLIIQLWIKQHNHVQNNLNFRDSNYDLQNTFIPFHKLFSWSLFAQWLSMIEFCIYAFPWLLEVKIIYELSIIIVLI